MFHLAWMQNTSRLHMLELKADALLIHYSKWKRYLLVLRFLSAWQITGEKYMQPEDRQEIVLCFLIIWCAMCSRATFYFSIVQFHCCEIYVIHSYDSRLTMKSRLGALWRTISKGHWTLDFLSAMFLVQPGCYLQSDDDRHQACFHWFSEKAPPLQKIHKTKVCILILLWWFLLCCWLRLIRI